MGEGSVEMCMFEVEREAIALAIQSTVQLNEELATHYWLAALKKFSLSRELEFFRDTHPYYFKWKEEREKKQ